MTKTVMRYTDGGPDGWMQSPTGEFVRYEDYARLERENRELQQLVPPDKFAWKLPDEPGTEPKLLAAEINALPQRVRDYIHHLESDADPAGDKWRLAAAEENVAALTAQLRAEPGAHPALTAKLCPNCGEELPVNRFR